MYDVRLSAIVHSEDIVQLSCDTLFYTSPKPPFREREVYVTMRNGTTGWAPVSDIRLPWKTATARSRPGRFTPEQRRKEETMKRNGWTLRIGCWTLNVRVVKARTP